MSASRERDVRPPRLPEWLLFRVLPIDARDAAIGDLNEDFADEVESRADRRAACRWYWRQALSLAFAFGSRRLRTALPDGSFISRSDVMRHDIRDAIRSLLRSPGYTLVTIAVLALGIGATSAIFSFVDAVLLKPLPYSDPDRIVLLWEKPPGGDRNAISTANFLDWQKATDVFETVVATTGSTVSLAGGAEPLQIGAARVSAGYFDVFGVRPAVGRTFTAGEDQPGRERVAVITHRLWVREFGADPGIVNRTIIIDREPYTIVGVMPSGSAFDRGWTDLWRPLAFGPGERTRNFHWLRALGRLKNGVTLEQARARMDAIGARIARDYPDSNEGWGITIDRFSDAQVDPDLRQSLKVLLAAVGVLLLVACANLANLALARGTAREREVVVRAALGASRFRIVRQFLTESMFLAAAGGLVGIGVGHVVMNGLQLLLPPLYLPREAMVGIDARALLFTGSVSILTGVIFGTIPALQAGRVDLTGSMKGTGRTVTADRVRRRLRDSLVVIEIALACTLLVGAGLLIRSFTELQKVESVPDPATLLTTSMPASDTRFASAEEARMFFRRVLERTAAIPGVSSVALTSAVPMQGWNYGIPLRIAGRAVDNRAASSATGFKIVSSAYFATVGLPVRRGRGFFDTDQAEAMPVAVINEAMSARFFPGEDAIGQHIITRRIVPGRRELGPEIPWEVVGIVANERVDSLNAPESDGMYVPLDQSTHYAMGLVLRTSGAAGPTARALKAAVQEIDPAQPLSEIKSVEQIRNESVAPDRLRTWLLGVFSALALLLAAVGIYGVISYSVAQQVHEIGLRAALGATRTLLVRQVMTRAALLTGVGLAIGLITALASSRVLESLLFGVTARDGLSLAGAAVSLGIVALFAAWAPARRAASVDPLVALRAE